MGFFLLSHGRERLQLASDDGHHFLFDVVSSGGRRRIAVGEVAWMAGRQPTNSNDVMKRASTFALACAQDFGLL